VVLGRTGTPSPGERRFVASLESDPRFDLTCLTAQPRPNSAMPAIMRLALGLERAVFRGHDRAPPLTRAVEPLSAAHHGAFDVVVDFSGAAAVMELAARASEGVWRLSAFADGAGFAEARDRAPVSQVTLMRHRAQGAPQPIASTSYDTKFLATRNAAFLREKSVLLISQALARLAVTGSAETGAAQPEARRPVRLRDLPGYMLRATGQLVTRAQRQIGERIGLRPGMFLLRLGNGGALDFDPASAVDIVPTANCFWADPFLFEHEGALYVFYEEYDYRTSRGHLSVGRLDGERLVPVGTALKRPYHLSYPFVFRWQDEILMIPETHETKRIEVWRATDFPTGWELANVALEGVETSDTVVFERDGAWWMMTNICQDSFHDFNTELYLYRVDGPMLNDVDPHPLNPVVIDSTTARGGGRVFEVDGKLYRTSQDNSHGTYGFGLNVMEITRLDATGYEEQRLRHVVPDFGTGIMACHHMDAAAGRFIIDVRRRSVGAPDMKRGLSW
jgi:hypothetical protein